MQLHELIDREDPKCLYCDSFCDDYMDGESISHNINYYVQIFRCRKCHETFEIHWIDDMVKTKMQGFLFTCEPLTVFNLYNKGFSIGGKELHFSRWKSLNPGFNFIEEFEVDFSNKNKLLEKLKTYLIFS